MKKSVLLPIAAVMVMTTGAQALDLFTSYTPMNKLAYVEQTDNVGLEIGHYIDNDKQGFGMSWRVAVTSPTDFKWLEGGTVETGIAPGYTIVENLVTKLELGFGLHTYDSYGTAGGFYYGGSINYTAWDHLLLGLAVRQWKMYADVYTGEDGTGEELSYNYTDTRTTAYIGYRF